MFVAKRRTFPSLMSAVNVANGSVWFVVEPNTVRYASVVLSPLGPCTRLASTISNLLFVASEIDMKYFALLYVADAKLSTTEVVDDATVVVLSFMSEWFNVADAVANQAVQLHS